MFFTTFLKQLVQSFTDPHCTADLQFSITQSSAKAKLPHNVLTKRTECTVKCPIEVPTLLCFQHWLKILAEVVENGRAFLFTDTSHTHTGRDLNRPKPFTSTPKKTTFKSHLQPVALHFIAVCPHYLEAFTSDNFALVRKHQLCFKSLSISRQKIDCPSRNHCYVPRCSASHHISLHPVDQTALRSSPTVRSADRKKHATNEDTRLFKPWLQ